MDYNYTRNLDALYKEANQLLKQMDAAQLNAADKEYTDIMENLVKLNNVILNEEKRMDEHEAKLLELENEKMKAETDRKRQFVNPIVDASTKTATTLISVLGTGALALVAYDLDAEQVASKGVQTLINLVTKFFPKN